MTNQIGADLKGDPVFWNEWVFSGTNNLSSGFNGVVKKLTSKQISIPLYNYLNYRGHESVMVDHELILSIKEITTSDVIQTGVQTVMHTRNTRDIDAWIENVWNPFKMYILISICSLVILFIVLLVCRKTKRTRHIIRDLNSNSIELL